MRASTITPQTDPQILLKSRPAKNNGIYTQTNQVYETIPKEMRRGDGSVAPTSQTSSQT